MDTVNPQCRVRQCFKCQGDAEYFCSTCNTDLCLQCKGIHGSDLKLVDHDIVINRGKMNNNFVKVKCTRHPQSVCGIYCIQCEIPVCFECLEHKEHQFLDLRTAYKSKLQPYRRFIANIKSRIIPYSLSLLAAAKADIEICRTESNHNKSHVLQRSQRLISNMGKMFRYVEFKHRCLKQKTYVNKYIASIKRYENVNEQSNISPTQFLLFIKKTSKPEIQDSLHLKHHTCQLSMNESIIKKDVMESLLKIQFKEKGKRREENDRVLKMMPVPELIRSLIFPGFNGCRHMSFVTEDRIWVHNENKNLIMTNLTGRKLHHVKDICNAIGDGLHTVNRNNELIYINQDYDIIKLSNDMKKSSLLISPKYSKKLPLCIYWSASTGDLLVGTYSEVNRYDQNAKWTQTIKHSMSGLDLYKYPSYITENNNGDVIVSDSIKMVVVTERGGRHRFTFTGNPPNSLLHLNPGGICTDALSHILVCDGENKTVQMINENGQFLSHLLIRPHGIFQPHSLVYDKETHLLWVGSAINNRVSVYKYMYINQQSNRRYQNPPTDDKVESRNSIQVTEIKNLHVNGKESLPKLEPHESYIVTDVSGCFHISFPYMEFVWISDNEENLVLMGTTLSDSPEENISHIKDLCCEFSNYYGIHTVNTSSDLIYIDSYLDIFKDDFEISTPFLKKSYSKMKPKCLYWSVSSDDLLVGMHSVKPMAAMVSRFNEAGQLTQTIQHDSTGQEIYCEPNYITENNNGDIVVSDFDIWSGAVVVTERGGRHRFSYTGHPSGSGLRPAGICTDALSNILVCDGRNETVQIIDKDGKFMSHILTKSQNLNEPLSLCYDEERHHLWVGSWYDNLVRVYKYIYHHDTLSGEDSDNCSNGNAISRLPS